MQDCHFSKALVGTFPDLHALGTIQHSVPNGFVNLALEAFINLATGLGSSDAVLDFRARCLWCFFMHARTISESADGTTIGKGYYKLFVVALLARGTLTWPSYVYDALPAVAAPSLGMIW
jgi:hypothetical protein